MPLSYSIIIATLPETDNQGDIFQAVNGVYSNLAERDVVGVGVNKVVGRYVLNGVTVNGQEVTAYVWLGFGVQTRSDQVTPAATAKIEAVSAFQNAASMQVIFTPPPTPITRDWVIQRLKQMAYEHGCSKVWVVQPGDSTSVANAAELLAKFSPLP